VDYDADAHEPFDVHGYGHDGVNGYDYAPHDCANALPLFL
jgi:hypothetical protein